MSGLFDSLTTASGSLAAAQLGMSVAGQNIANVNTPGYTRRIVSLEENAPTDALSAGHGVSASGIQAARDQFVMGRLWTELQGGGYEGALLQGLTDIEAAIGLPGQSIDAELAEFFATFSTLADDPTSSTAREGVVLQAAELTRAFHDLSGQFDAITRGADTAIMSGVDEVNQLASEVAELNEAILANGADVESLRDRREVAVSRLSELAGVSVIRTSNGNIDLALGSGRPLVVGVSTFAVSVTQNASGLATVMSGGFDITGELSGGRLGGLIHLRDTVIPDYRTRLDQLAYDVAASVNALHVTGYDASGNAGGTFFVPLASATNAASLLSVDPAVSADGALVAASGTGAPGDNTIARALAALRDAPVTLGGSATPAAGWANLVFRVGGKVASTRAAVERHDDLRTQLERIRDQSAGVSLDEEAANLMRFQRAYEANARYFTTIADTLNTLMNMVG